MVLDADIEFLNDYWKGLKIDAFPVIPIAVLCANSEASKLYDEDTICSYLKAGVQDHVLKAELKVI